MPGIGMCIVLMWGLSTGTGTSTPFPLAVPVRAAADGRRWVVVVVPDVRAAEVRVLDRAEVFAPDDREPDVRDAELPDVRERDAEDVREPDAPDVDRDEAAREPDAFEPDVELDARAPDVFAPELLVPELRVRVAVPRDAVLVLVALPASAIPSHPPAHVPERVVRLSPCCFRQQVAPCLTPQIQTDLFPGHGGAMASVRRNAEPPAAKPLTSPHCRPPGPADRTPPGAAGPPSHRDGSPRTPPWSPPYATRPPGRARPHDRRGNRRRTRPPRPPRPPPVRAGRRRPAGVPRTGPRSRPHRASRRPRTDPAGPAPRGPPNP